MFPSILTRFARRASRLLRAVLSFVAAFSAANVSTFASTTSKVRFVPDVPYLAAGRSEKLDLYLPAPSAEPAPAVVWIHGRRGDKGEKRGRSICETLAAAGYVCVSINHGPDQALQSNLLDCKNAVRFLRQHAADYHLDPSRIAIMGGSMGGYYALLVGFTAGRSELEPTEPYPRVSSSVRAVVDFYGLMGPPGLDVPKYITPQGPPVLILHGDDDTTVPVSQSVTLAEALAAKGVVHKFIRLPGVGHTFRLNATWDDKPLPLDLGPVLLSFLQQHLGSPPIVPATPTVAR
jgi:acetyl esterase/lipase